MDKAWLGAIAAFLAATVAQAMSPDNYVAALKIAEKQFAKKRDRENAAGALSAPLLRSLLGRPYRVGDRWEVAVQSDRPTMMRMTDDPARLLPVSGPVGVFRYEVTETRPGGEVIFRVTPLAARGVGPIDSRVLALTLTASERLRQSAKVYAYEGGRPVRSGLDLLPLDVPELETASPSEVSSLPEIPDALKRVAAQAAYAPDPARSAWFEQDDFFGRPVQALWQKGDPWPAYLKTPHGVAILLSKEVSP